MEDEVRTTFRFIADTLLTPPLLRRLRNPRALS